MKPTGDRSETVRGVAYGLGAYGIWGCFPLLFAMLEGIPSWEVLIHRVIWCCVFLVLLVSVLGRWKPIVEALAHPARLGRVFACAVLIGANWALFIYAVESRQVFQSSLGYFMTPLVNVALGILVLKERMARLQVWALGLAGGAIALQLLLLGQLPWIALLLALSFGTYGLLRKQVPLDGLSGLFVETLLLMPLGLMALAWLLGSGGSHFLDDAWQSSLLVFCGAITALPLMLFAGATRRLKLSTVGFLMYINPTMQFLTAWLIFGETLTRAQLLSFGLIWAALALYSWSAWRQRSK